MKIFTIGHSNHSIEKFIGLVQKHQINVVIDVRSVPQSRYSPQFNRDALCESLRQAGIAMVHSGDSLGGRPQDGSLWAGGAPSWGLIAESEPFKRTIASLVKNLPVWSVGSMTLMCSEENPERCHRRGLVGKALIAAGVEVEHLRGDGSVETEARVAERAGETGPDILELLSS
jgi:uncharacterized protein (DUF488 family)